MCGLIRLKIYEQYLLKMDDNFIIVGTTAINRSDLHDIVLPKWKKWLLDSKKHIIWFINVDVISHLCESYDDTKKNLEILLDHQNIKLIILPQQHNKFLGACKELSKSIKKYVDDQQLNITALKIVWLEDDWELIGDINFNDVEKYCNNCSHINLTGIKHNYIWALAPSILSYNFWINIFYKAWENQHCDMCPEKCVGIYFQSNYCASEKIQNIVLNINDTINNENINIKEPIFIKLYPHIAVDVGIEYMKNKNIKKKFVKKNRIVTMEYEHKTN